MAFDLFGWLRGALSPAKVTGKAPLTNAKPLWEQFQRIGGGITPLSVSQILRDADGGQPARFVDLVNESRQKDGHLQSVLWTRESAPALTDLDFIEPKDATAEEKKATDTCRRIRDEFRNWSELIEHLNGCLFGHATAELKWERRPDGFVLPRSAKTLHARDFIFRADTGELRYSTGYGDMVGVDLLADNPGRIIQVQRRLVGDAAVREGLARILVWAALLRNWGLRDWISLGEIGWKPWRLGTYTPGSSDEDIERLVTILERVGAQGIAVFPNDYDVRVEWPKGQGTSQNGSTHRELFETLGREMSKTVVGQTTSTESGPHGTKGDAQVRDRVRSDIREADCRVIAGPLLWHMFEHAVAINHGANVRCSVPWFQTEDSADLLDFSKAMLALRQAGLAIPAKWVRDETGMPEPAEGDELLEAIDVEVETDDDDEPKEPGTDPERDEEAKAA